MSIEKNPEGWEIIPDYGDARLGENPYVEGPKNTLKGDALTVLTAFCKAFHSRVEPIVRAKSWGYAPRKIAGSTSWSRHAMGIAVDLNPHVHVEGRDTYSSEKHGDIRALLEEFPVIRWGGDYSGRSLDQMHFEIYGTPESVSAFVKSRGGMIVSSKMVSPVEGRVSSHFGQRNGVLHAGMDISGSGRSKPVYAAFGGVLSNVVQNRVHDRSAGQVKNRGKSRVAAGRSGNGARVNNPDGEVQVYIHLNLLDGLKSGDRVSAGQHIGYTDLSGNTTGHHLHFETWNANKAPVDPREYFKAHDISPGADPETGAVAPTPTPAPTPKPTPTPPPATGFNQFVYAVQGALKDMGYYKGKHDGIDGSMTKSATLDYQRDQNVNGDANLAEDGDWGQKTDNWYHWTRSLQNALNGYMGRKIRVDGNYGGDTNARVKEVQSLPAGKRAGLRADGIAGNVTTGWMRRLGTSIADRP